MKWVDCIGRQHETAGVNSTETDEVLRAAYTAERKRLPVGGRVTD
jgi:hypothetical protein